MYNLLEYSSNYSDETGSLSFYSKDEANNFNADIADDNAFKSFSYKVKLLGNTSADGVNEILKQNNCCTIKYLSNSWRALKMPLINCKVQLNLKRTGHFVLSAAGADNANVNSNSFIFTIKETKLYVSAVTYLQKATKSYQNVLVKSCKDQCIRINLKQKVKIKARQTSAYYFESNFSGVNRFFMLVYSNQDDNPKRYKF